MNTKLIALVAGSMWSLGAGAGPIELLQDLGGLDLTVTLAPKPNPEAMRIDNNTQTTVSCSANFTGADRNRTEKVTIKPGKTATIRIPANRGGMPRTAELKCRGKTPG
jgi:hypothetical protein